ncbi:MAG TPA: energy transducer TonB [Thermoanaerobaculia bacterium]
MKTLCLAALLPLLSIAALGSLGSNAAAGAPPAPLADASTPLRVGGDVTRPEKLSGATPTYTDEARAARLQGVVILEAVIDENGNVTDARVLKGLPMGLDDQALTAVRTWNFKPATLAGRPVKVYYVLTVNFRVEGGVDPRALLKRLAALRGEFPDPVKPDAAAVAPIRADVVAGRMRLADAVRWAEDYKGESRTALLVWLGAEAGRRAAELPPAHSNRAWLLQSGIAATDAAIVGEGWNAHTMTVVEAKGYKGMLLAMQAQAIADPIAKRSVEQASDHVLQEAESTLQALASAATRNQNRKKEPGAPTGR